MFFNRDITSCAVVSSNTGATASIEAVISGGAGNRVGVITWRGYDIFGDASTQDDPFTVEVLC